MVTYQTTLQSGLDRSTKLTKAEFRNIAGDTVPAINSVSLRYYRWAAAMDLGITPQARMRLERLDPPQTMDAREEQRLFSALRSANCPIAFATLEASLRHLAVSIAGRFANRGVSHERLLLLSHQGVLAAISGFDPSEGRRLSSWAVWPITVAVRSVFKSAPMVTQVA